MERNTYWHVTQENSSELHLVKHWSLNDFLAAFLHILLIVIFFTFSNNPLMAIMIFAPLAVTTPAYFRRQLTVSKVDKEGLFNRFDRFSFEHVNRVSVHFIEQLSTTSYRVAIYVRSHSIPTYSLEFASSEDARHVGKKLAEAISCDCTIELDNAHIDTRKLLKKWLRNGSTTALAVSILICSFFYVYAAGSIIAACFEPLIGGSFTPDTLVVALTILLVALLPFIGLFLIIQSLIHGEKSIAMNEKLATFTIILGSLFYLLPLTLGAWWIDSLSKMFIYTIFLGPLLIGILRLLHMSQLMKKSD